MMLPDCIRLLILSFLPPPVKPYVPVVKPYYMFDYMSTEDWCDTEDVRAYGDY